MRHFSASLCLLALGLAIEMGTSCSKQTLPPASTNVVVKDFKVIQQDTATSQPSTNHGCSGHVGGQG